MISIFQETLVHMRNNTLTLDIQRSETFTNVQMKIAKAENLILVFILEVTLMNFTNDTLANTH